MECVKTAKPPDRGSPRGLVVRPSEKQSVLRPDHEPLHELSASVLLVEAQRPQVPEELAVGVARRPLGYRPLPLDHQGTVARFPSAGFVLLLQPVGDDGLAAPHHLLALVVGMIGVGGVLREEGSYGRGVVSAPSVHVSLDPPLHGFVGQDTPPSVTSKFSCLIILTMLTVSGPTVTPPPTSEHPTPLRAELHTSVGSLHRTGAMGTPENPVIAKFAEGTMDELQAL